MLTPDKMEFDFYIFSKKELGQLIEKCFSLGQNGHTCEDDRKNYIDYALNFVNKLTYERETSK